MVYQTKVVFEGAGYCIADLGLPENIYNVGERYGYSEQLGDLHYDLFDKVEHNSDNYYYLSYSENSHLYRYFSDVKSSINTGAFKLTLPTKDELGRYSLPVLWTEQIPEIIYPIMMSGGIKIIGILNLNPEHTIVLCGWQKAIRTCI